MPQPVTARRNGRVTVDERGVRKAPFLFFFGSPFDLRWDEIAGWAASEAVLAGPNGPVPVEHTLELHTAKTVHFCGGVGLRFAAVIEKIRKRLPDRRTESVLTAVRRAREQ